MKSKHIIGLTAALFFVVSHLLPAFHEELGYQCFLLCIVYGDHPYYWAFVLTNVLFVGLLAALFRMQRFARFRWLLSLSLLLQILSWFLFNAWADYQKHATDNLHALRIGYYVWLSAYALLFWAHGLKDQAPNRPTGADAGGPHPLAIRIRWASRLARLRRVAALPH